MCMSFINSEPGCILSSQQLIAAVQWLESEAWSHLINSLPAAKQPTEARPVYWFLLHTMVQTAWGRAPPGARQSLFWASITSEDWTINTNKRGVSVPPDLQIWTRWSRASPLMPSICESQMNGVLTVTDDPQRNQTRHPKLSALKAEVRRKRISKPAQSTAESPPRINKFHQRIAKC